MWASEEGVKKIQAACRLHELLSEAKSCSLPQDRAFIQGLQPSFSMGCLYLLRGKLLKLNARAKQDCSRAGDKFLRFGSSVAVKSVKTVCGFTYCVYHYVIC